jgi:hypothetical protein
MSLPLEKIRSTATADPKSHKKKTKIELKKLHTWNAENITCETVKVRPIMPLAPPPSCLRWILCGKGEAMTGE